MSLLPMNRSITISHTETTRKPRDNLTFEPSIMYLCLRTYSLTSVTIAEPEEQSQYLTSCCAVVSSTGKHTGLGVR